LSEFMLEMYPALTPA